MQIRLDQRNDPNGNLPEVITQINRERFLVQWPSTFAFYAVWGISVLDAARYHQQHPPTTPLPPKPGLGRSTPGTPGLWVSGRF
jgi:hypothetical protein